MKAWKADFLLILVTIGWGASFILTKIALVELSVFNMLAIRFIIAFFMSSIIFLKEMKKIDVKTLKYGILVGTLLFVCFTFQTLGLNRSIATKTAFISGLSVVLVPLITTILNRKAPNLKITVSVILAVIGMGLMTLKGKVNGVNLGDIFSFISAVTFALYIISVSKYTKVVKAIPFAIIQLGTVATMCILKVLTTETFKIPVNLDSWISILILSIVCTSGAYIIQNVVQKYTSATHTALIFTAEPVFAAFFAFIIFNEFIGLKGIFGAVLILIGMLVAEFGNFKKKV